MEKSLLLAILEQIEGSEVKTFINKNFWNWQSLLHYQLGNQKLEKWMCPQIFDWMIHFGDKAERAQNFEHTVVEI